MYELMCDLLTSVFAKLVLSFSALLSQLTLVHLLSIFQNLVNISLLLFIFFHFHLVCVYLFCFLTGFLLDFQEWMEIVGSVQSIMFNQSPHVKVNQDPEIEKNGLLMIESCSSVMTFQ